MARFVEETLGLTRVDTSGVDAEMFELPDGARFAVADEREPGAGTSRTIGFLVSDIEAAAAELGAAGTELGEIEQNDRQRYAHFVAPDGALYELVEERPAQ